MPYEWINRNGDFLARTNNIPEKGNLGCRTVKRVHRQIAYLRQMLWNVLYKTGRIAMQFQPRHIMSRVRMNVPKRDIELTGSNFESLAV